jgi:hypothetical protein
MIKQILVNVLIFVFEIVLVPAFPVSEIRRLFLNLAAWTSQNIFSSINQA